MGPTKYILYKTLLQYSEHIIFCHSNPPECDSCPYSTRPYVPVTNNLVFFLSLVPVTNTLSDLILVYLLKQSHLVMLQDTVSVRTDMCICVNFLTTTEGKHFLLYFCHHNGRFPRPQLVNVWRKYWRNGSKSSVCRGLIHIISLFPLSTISVQSTSTEEICCLYNVWMLNLLLL